MRENIIKNTTYTEPIHDFPLPNKLVTEFVSETPWTNGEIATFPKIKEDVILKNKTK